MNITLVYDSVFGNTRAVATAIGDALAPMNRIKVLTVQEAKGVDLADTDLLIVGSPTRGFRPTPHISEYLESLDRVPAGKAAAAFDTRLDLDTVHPPPLRWMMDAGGYAAERMGSMLERHGFVVKGGLAGFLVTGAEGPLKEGEIERAKQWGTNLLH